MAKDVVILTVVKNKRYVIDIIEDKYWKGLVRIRKEDKKPSNPKVVHVLEVGKGVKLEYAMKQVSKLKTRYSNTKLIK